MLHDLEQIDVGSDWKSGGIGRDVVGRFKVVSNYASKHKFAKALNLITSVAEGYKIIRF